MTSFLDKALKLAEHFPVFPLLPNSKIPAIDEWQIFATRKPDQIRRWWRNGKSNCNIGVARQGILPVDIDDKDDRHGSRSIEILDLMGNELPETFTQTTPSGGRHLVYRCDDLIRNSIGGLASGVDIPGYIVGAGSTLNGKPYTADWKDIAVAPPWLVKALKSLAPSPKFVSNIDVDEKYAIHRAREFLRIQSGALKGTRDSMAYQLAAQLKDLGVPVMDAYDLIDELWCPKCEPPFTSDELVNPVNNAFQYGKNKGPVAAAEAVFGELPILPPPLKKSEPEPEPEPPPATRKDPVSTLNEQYAFIFVGDVHRILYQPPGKEMKCITEDTFHAKFKNKFITTGDGKGHQLSKLWMASPYRRDYEGFCFEPALGPEPDGHYNLWRGFAETPTATGSAYAVAGKDAFLEHLAENICEGSEYLTHWVTAWFADIIQRPAKKPGVALVLRGKKGVGKNVIVECFGHLLGRHAFLASDRRYLASNFNGYLKDCLMVTFNEACWAGDKQTEGILKGLITDGEHNIELKGKEVYRVRNHTHVAILGNEDWLVPATADERRYAVLDVGESRREDHKFFGKMRDGLDAGGYSLLLDYFMKYDYSDVNLRKAPTTTGLLDQKITSLSFLSEWWFQCLRDGRVPIAFEDNWPTQIRTPDLRDQLLAFARKKNSHARLPHEKQIGKDVRPFGLIRQRENTEERLYYYSVPELDEAREMFNVYIGQEVEWD